MESFMRTEMKYLLKDTVYRNLKAVLNRHLTLDANGRYTVGNVYYDTENYALARASIEKPVFKEKLRLRSYGIPKRTDVVFIEIKRKYDGMVYKRRIGMPLSAAERYLNTGVCIGSDDQIMHELAYFLAQYPLHPKVYIGYEREAYVDPNDNLRITVDTAMRFRKSSLHLDKGDWGEALLESPLCLVEIKAFQSYPLWLTNLLCEQSVFPVSFSKYGAFYGKCARDSATIALTGGSRLCFQPC